MVYAKAAAIIAHNLVIFQSILEAQLNCAVRAGMMSWCRRSHEEGALGFAAA